LALAKKHRSEVVFLNIVEVHEGQQLVAGITEARADRPLLREAETLAVGADVPARTIVRVSHRLSKGIVDTAREENCNFIVMGRQQKPDFLERAFSSFIDTILYELPSEIAVLHGVFRHGDVKKIVVPFGIDIHSRLAMEFSSVLADYFNADVTVTVVFDPMMTKAEQETRLDQVHEEVLRSTPTASVEVIRRQNVLAAVVKKSKEADLMVMGGKTGDFIELLFGASLTRRITEQAGCPVLWLREYEERVSFWSSLFKRKTAGGKRDE
jgi:nucleotide-binding universal stress UspA family protein